jgi:hypothetical protein
MSHSVGKRSLKQDFGPIVPKPVFSWGSRELNLNLILSKLNGVVGAILPPERINAPLES